MAADAQAKSKCLMSFAYDSRACSQNHGMPWWLDAWCIWCPDGRQVAEANRKKQWDSTTTIHNHIQLVMIFEDQALHNALMSGRSCWLATQSWANSNSRLAADIWCSTSYTLCTKRLTTPTTPYYFYLPSTGLPSTFSCDLHLLSASSRFPSSSVSPSPHTPPYSQARIKTGCKDGTPSWSAKHMRSREFDLMKVPGSFRDISWLVA